MRTCLALLLAALVPLTAWSQETPVGTWKTIDDNDGLPAGIVRIEERNGLFEGHVVKILPRPGKDVNALCAKCEGENKNKPVTGMKILWDMKRDGDKFSGGKIFDPDSGNTYGCTMKVVGNTLQVRGFIGFSLLGRTQTWFRE